MPTEYETRGTCTVCGKVRSLDWMRRRGAGWVCEPPPDPRITENERYRPAWDEYQRTHGLWPSAASRGPQVRGGG